MEPRTSTSSALVDNSLQMTNTIFPSSPNPTADELEAFQIALAHNELAKLDKRQSAGSDVNHPPPDVFARRATLRLRLQSEQIKRKPVPQRSNKETSDEQTSNSQGPKGRGSNDQKPGGKEPSNKQSNDIPERVRLFEDIRYLILGLCFGNTFTDRIPRLHPVYGIKKGARQFREFLDGDRRRFHGKVHFDMRCFHDLVTRDEQVPNKALEGKNVALRWLLAKFIWDIVCENILLEMGEIDEDEVLWQTAEHIQGSTRPFWNQKTDELRAFAWFHRVAVMAAELRSMLMSDSTATYHFKLPPNSKGSCVGNGSPRHALMINLHGEESEAIRKIHGVVFGALVRRVRGPSGALGRPQVECPAWVTEYSLGDF